MSTLAQTLDVVTDGIPGALINPNALSRLKAGARELPDILSSGLECRLGENSKDQVDVQLCVTKGTPDVETLRTFLSERTDGKDGPWQRLDSLVAKWIDPGSALHDQIVEIWLEFDCTQNQLSPPSVFLGLPQSPQPADSQRPAVDAALTVLLDEDALDRCRDTVHQCFDACGPDIFVSHLGIMLGRDTDAVRVNVKRLDGDTIADYLTNAGWRGSKDAASALAKRALDAVDRITLCLDAGAKIADTFGLECIQALGKAGAGDWDTSIRHLGAMSSMDSDKCTAIPQWYRTLTPESSGRPWPRKLIAASLFPGTKVRSQIECRISHLKLSCAGRAPVEAKAYLAFNHVWAATDPQPKADIDQFYSDDDVDLWQQVLGPDLHFHFGLFKGNEDLQTGSRQTVQSFFPHIPFGSTVLDLGCGWGGPAKVLSAEQGCDVTGITVSKAQAAFCRDAGLDVRLLDLDEASAVLPQGFDVLFSLEMISYIQDKAGFLRRLRQCGRRLVLSESCAADGYDGPRLTFGGSMQLCTVSELAGAVEQAGWTIRSAVDRRPQSMRTVSLWKQNLDRTFTNGRPPGAFAPLHSLIENAQADPAGWAKSFPLIDIVAD